MEPFWSSQWHALCGRCFGAQGYATLSRAEKAWINVRALIDSTNNGGLIASVGMPLTVAIAGSDAAMNATKSTRTI